MKFLPYATGVFLALTLAACGDTPDEATSTTTSAADVAGDALPAEQDQVRGTRNADPATLDPARLDNPAAPAKEEMTEATPPAASPSAPATSPAPATAPKTETQQASAPAKSNATPPSPPAPVKERAALPPPPPPVSAEEVVQEPVVEEVVEEGFELPPGGSINHARFDRLLNTYVNASGKVNYAGLKQNEAELDKYLEMLAGEVPDGRWDRNKAKAYWLNAYNAFTLKLILNNYPVASIRDLHGGKPWDVKWIKLGNKTYSLNQIEHDIIRPTYKDPRIHFAVVCAANSCPPLASEAFTADNVNSLLETRTRGFIRNGKFNTTGNGRAEVSKIFDWYAEDFGDVRGYLNKYLATPIAEGTELTYADYDWGLNKQ